MLSRQHQSVGIHRLSANAEMVAEVYENQRSLRERMKAAQVEGEEARLQSEAAQVRVRRAIEVLTHLDAECQRVEQFVAGVGGLQRAVEDKAQLELGGLDGLDGYDLASEVE